MVNGFHSLHQYPRKLYGFHLNLLSAHHHFLILMSAAASGDAPPDAAANFFSLKCNKTLYNQYK